MVKVKPTRRKWAWALAVACLMACSTPSALQAQSGNTTWSTAQGDQRNAYIQTINMLDADGYRITRVDRTFLNRIMVQATKGQIRREIVISQATGMVLRDVIFGE